MTVSAPPNTSKSERIRFVLDGKVIELHDVDPTRTVLQYLRDDLRRTGTKEGCAEGDCGACTVAVAELTADGTNIIVRAINACIQFLPTLDGKELITVESLIDKDGSLHPVQQAMVDCHGSQCGFCTPGFVMSLFAMYKSNPNPSRREIDDALAGNLCRCTGYRPIIAAAQTMARYADEDRNDNWLWQPGAGKSAPSERVDTLKKVRRTVSLRCKSGSRTFYAPTTTDELGTLIGDFPEATLLAGGTDVGLWVTKQHRELDTVIYTGRVQEMCAISESETDLQIGAAVTLTDAMPAILNLYPHFEELLLRFASPPIRNAGTLGGNIANGSPIGDSMPALIAANTSLLLRSANGSREVLLEDFYRDYMVNELQAGEFVESVHIPKPEDTDEFRSYKVSKRFDQDISAVCAGFALRRKGKKVESIRIAFGGLAATVRRATKCEAAMSKQNWSKSTVERGMQALSEDFTPISDMRSSSAYRLRVAQNLLRRFLLETSGKNHDTVYGYGRAD